MAYAAKKPTRRRGRPNKRGILVKDKIRARTRVADNDVGTSVADSDALRSARRVDPEERRARVAARRCRNGPRIGCVVLYGRRRERREVKHAAGGIRRHREERLRRRADCKCRA